MAAVAIIISESKRETKYSLTYCDPLLPSPRLLDLFRRFCLNADESRTRGADRAKNDWIRNRQSNSGRYLGSTSVYFCNLSGLTTSIHKDELTYMDNTDSVDTRNSLEMLCKYYISEGCVVY